jgi:hypothetical protein
LPTTEAFKKALQDAAMTEDEFLAGAKFYARASAQRAVNGIIPNWDGEADDANWQVVGFIFICELPGCPVNGGAFHGSR